MSHGEEYVYGRRELGIVIQRRREDVPCRVIIILQGEGFELYFMFVLQGRILPLALGFEEQSKGIAAR